MFTPDLDTVFERFGPRPLLFEITPPPVDAESEETNKRRAGLQQLFSTVDVSAVNLPEIQEESQKGDRGERKSSFKRRVTPRNYAARLRERFDVDEFVVNRVIVQATGAEQERWLHDTFTEYGIRNVVLVGGESSEVDYPGPSVPEGNTLVKQALNESGGGQHGEPLGSSTDYLVGNICISTRRRDDFDEPDRMAKKIRAGADFFTTQIVAERKSPRRLIKDLGHKLEREDNLKPPALFWSFAPINAPKDVNFLRWLGVRIPDDVEERILSSANPATESVAWARTIWEEIQAAERELSVSIPLGLNVSLVAPRNFEFAIELARTLADSTVQARPT